MEWGKLILNVDRRDVESPIQIVLMDVLISLKNCLGCSVGEVIDCCEVDLSAQGEKEWNLVYKEDVRCQRHFAMEFEEVLGHLHKILGHMSCFRACGLSFEGSYVFAPYFIGRDNVVNGNWAVLDLTALDNPFEVFHGRVSMVGVQSLCKFCSLELSFRKSHFIVIDSMDVECEVIILGIVVV